MRRFLLLLLSLAGIAVFGYFIYIRYGFFLLSFLPTHTSPTQSPVSPTHLLASPLDPVPMLQSIHDMQPYWVTVEPKTKPECLKVSNGELNPAYVRCINGYQQQITKDANGNTRVLSERPIPQLHPSQGIYR